MPIISTIGRRSLKIRLVLTLIYSVLGLGAVTMVYPFVVMIGTSFTSEVDHDEFAPIPAYFFEDRWLYRKYLESKFNEELPRFNTYSSGDLSSFKEIEPPAGLDNGATEEWLRFKPTLRSMMRMLGSSSNLSRVTPEMGARYRVWLQNRYRTLEAVNEAYRESNATWEEVMVPIEDWTIRSYQPTRTRKYVEFLEFRALQPERYFWTVSGDGLFQDWLKLRYGPKMDELNAKWGSSYGSRAEIRLPERLPEGNAQRRKDWEEFVRKELPSQFVQPDPSQAEAYRWFLKSKYPDIEAFRQRYELTLSSFDEIPLPDPPPGSGVPFADWLEFLERAVAIDQVHLTTPDVLFRVHLARNGPVQLRSQAGSISPPYLAAEWVEMRADSRAIRWEFAIRNYREVMNYIILHGPAVWNTFVLCAGLLCVTLIVNPLCAYALSRYSLPSTYKILLFLLATMAFPAEVSAIPNFLLLKQLHLLNTYWALILPAMANGYSIFLLKGFFDSLPQELYEAAQLDGASEPMMFTRITLPTSKPVLAVISLGTFTTAYGSFLWAFLVCQDPDKWTLMVWLSQMQAWAPMFVIFAALVLAALPTLAVFVLCQNIIMRGIIIPTEK